MISIFQRDHNELTKTVARVHSLEELSEDDENANEDKSDIGYISDVSTEVDKVGNRTKISSKQKTRKRQPTSKGESEPPKKAKKISQKQV